MFAMPLPRNLTTGSRYELLTLQLAGQEILFQSTKPVQKQRANQEMSMKPNILFILVDQMRMPPSQVNLTPRLAELNQVLSFDPAMKDDNPFLAFFPPFAACAATGCA